MPTGIDQSWSFTNPAQAKAAGVQVVSDYLSRDPSKNWTATQIKAYHAAGIAGMLNWEHQAGAPLNGAAQGKADATEAVRQARALIKAVGYAPKNRLTLYFSCDRDVTAAQMRGPVAAYYKAAKAVCHAAGFGVGVYGEADVVEYLAAQGITDGEWQTYAWSGGRLVPAADFYQYNNGQKIGGASVDFDRVIHADQLGAWWPPNHARNVSATPATPSNLLELIMSLDRNSADYKALMADIRQIVNSPTWKSARDGYKAGYSPDTIVRFAVTDDAGKAVGALGGKVDGIAQVLSTPKTGVLARVASLQASVDKVTGLVAAITPAAATAADAAKVADAVVAKIKALVWKVGA